MFRTKLFTASALALAFTLMGTQAQAQIGEPRNEITYFTFSAPFELPGGKTLPAGKYAFELIDSPSNRHVVKIMSEDQSTVHQIVMAIPAQRPEPADEPQIRFMEAPANQAPAIRTWWYPGRVIGHEFIYPKDHARRLAAHQNEPVLTTAGDDADMKSADLARIDAQGQETAWEETRTADATAARETTQAAEAPTAQTGTEMTRSAEPATNPERMPETPATARTAAQTATQPQTTPEQPAQPQREAVDERAERTALPQTAGTLPIYALLGLGSLAGAGLLRRYRTRK